MNRALQSEGSTGWPALTKVPIRAALAMSMLLAAGTGEAGNAPQGKGGQLHLELFDTELTPRTLGFILATSGTVTNVIHKTSGLRFGRTLTHVVLEVSYDPYVAAYFTGTLLPGDALTPPQAIQFALTANVAPTVPQGGTLKVFGAAEVLPRPGETAADMVFYAEGRFGVDTAPADGNATLAPADAQGFFGLPGPFELSAPGSDSASREAVWAPQSPPEDIDVMQLVGDIETLGPFGQGGSYEAFALFCLENDGTAACPDPLVVRDEMRAALVPLPGAAVLLLSGLALLPLARRRSG